MTASDSNYNATAVIIQHPRADRLTEYEAWLPEIVPVCKSFLGHLGVTIIRLVAGITEEYTFLLRFDTTEHLTTWFESSERRDYWTESVPIWRRMKFILSIAVWISGSLRLKQRSRSRRDGSRRLSLGQQFIPSFLSCRWASLTFWNQYP